MIVCHEQVKINFFVEKQFKILEKNENFPDNHRYRDAYSIEINIYRNSDIYYVSIENVKNK